MKIEYFSTGGPFNKICLLVIILLFIYPATPFTSFYTSLEFNKQTDSVMQKSYPNFKYKKICNISDIVEINYHRNNWFHYLVSPTRSVKRNYNVLEITTKSKTFNIYPTFDDTLIVDNINDYLKSSKKNIYKQNLINAFSIIFSIIVFPYFLIACIKEYKEQKNLEYRNNMQKLMLNELEKDCKNNF